MQKQKKEVLMGGMELCDRVPADLRRPSQTSRINIRLEGGLNLSDDILRRPLLVMGEMGSGKSIMIREICRQIDAQRRPEDLLVIFCAKPELLEALYREGDVVISFDARDPACIPNIFRELGGSEVPSDRAVIVLREFISTIMAPFYRTTKEAFFLDAASDLLENLILTLRERAITEGTWEHLSNKYLLDTLDELGLYIDAGDGERRMAWELLVEQSPLLRHCGVYIGNTAYGASELCQSVLSQLTAVVKRTFVGAFAGEGTFSTVDAMKGGRIFLLCDHAESASTSAPLISTVLNRVLQLSLAHNREKEQRRTYVVLDEMAMLEKLNLMEAASYGRSAGCRLILCLQTTTLLKRKYTAAEAEQLLSLCPNILCFHTTCPADRDHISRRSGSHYVSVNDPCGSRLQISREPVINDEDYSLIARPGDAFCLVGSYEPFILHGHKEDFR